MNTNSMRNALLALAVIAGAGILQTRVNAQGFGGGGGGFGGGGGGGNNTAGRTTSSRSAASYPSSTQLGTATVSVDPETRRVFVVTDEETAEYVKQVVHDLDRPTPQVLIKCLFLEATFNKGSDIGVNGIYNYNISGAGMEALNGASGEAKTLYNLAKIGRASCRERV